MMQIGDMVRDTSDGTLSWSKVGAIVASAAFTYKMLHDLPDDWLIWAIYMLTVGGFTILLKFLNLKFGNGKD